MQHGTPGRKPLDHPSYPYCQLPFLAGKPVGFSVILTVFRPSASYDKWQNT